ncbi:MAG: hypothetical protein ABI644_06525 [Arenimonas sp.]
MLNNFRSVLLALGVIACLAVAPVEAKQKTVGNKAATPSAQALKLYQSLRDQDYKAIYYLLALTPNGRATLTNADQFALDVKKGYDSSFKTPQEKEDSDKLLASISNIMIGEAVITDNKAAIPTSSDITVNNQIYHFKGVAYLILDDGVWKLDLTFDENSEKTMAQRVSEMLGKPDPVK